MYNFQMVQWMEWGGENAIIYPKKGKEKKKTMNIDKNIPLYLVDMTHLKTDTG